jgi:pyruvate dehydrogenase E2 component (dihydrolipoamide acetyltransferase)
MATSIVMPALEMAQETGKIVSWVKKEGDAVKKGEILLEVETDKAVVEIEAQENGILGGVKSQAGDVVPVGQTIAWLLAPGEAVPAETKTAAASARTMTEQSKAAPAPTPVAAVAAAPSPASGKIEISPKARRLANELGVDITTVAGTGSDGMITSEDVQTAHKAGSSLPAIARIMAEKTTQAWTQIPHFFLTRELDATALNEARAKLSPGVATKLTHTDLLTQIVAKVLMKHPKMNGAWTGSGIKLNPTVNIGLAMAVKDGVVTAVIQKADTTKLADIAAQRKELTDRARDNKLKPADLAGGTFTITNLGMYDIDQFNAIIVAPQAGILAVGKIADRVVAVNGQPAVRPMLTLTLSADHRIVDGAKGAQFLKDIAEAVQNPAALLG